MPQPGYVAHPPSVTAQEFSRILEVRRQTLEDATRAEGSLFPMPVTWRHGWKATVRILGRDRDGSVLFTVSVKQPRSTEVYVRKCRLVCSKPLPWELGRELT
jgi:hypothetical protein